MADNDQPTPAPRPQPVLVGYLVALILGVASAVGVDLSNELAGQIGIAAAGLIGIAWTAWSTRNKVTPISDPVDSTGTPLVPVDTVVTGDGTGQALPLYDPDDPGPHTWTPDPVVVRIAEQPEPALPPWTLPTAKPKAGLFDGVDPAVIDDTTRRDR